MWNAVSGKEEDGLIDFHTHILPRIDDGSSSLEESLEMLASEREQGVSQVVLSPHFYADRDSVDAFLKRREEAYRQLFVGIQEQAVEVPRLHRGAEVNYFPDIGRAHMVSGLCIGETDMLLLEMPFCQWDRQVYEDVRQLIQKQGLRIIIAHMERYYPFQKQRKYWDLLFDLPVYAQMNAGSFLHWNRRRQMIKFMEEDYEILLGSDCHNMKNRQPNLQNARDVISQKMGKQYLWELDMRGERILQ